MKAAQTTQSTAVANNATVINNKASYTASEKRAYTKEIKQYEEWLADLKQAAETQDVQLHTFYYLGDVYYYANIKNFEIQLQCMKNYRESMNS